MKRESGRRSAPVRTTPFPSRKPFGREEIGQVAEALRSQNLFSVGGKKTRAFEAAFARRYRSRYALLCSSGTAAIHMAVGGLNPEPGSEIITAPVTDFGTIAGILYQGCIPVFADWRENTCNLDPEDVARKIGRRTAAIIVVHLFGNPCDMAGIMKVARKHRLPVIEDCCQAYFTTYRGRLAGTIGDIGCFSMQQSKHLTAGEGGIVITNHSRYGERIALFRDKGWSRRDTGPRTYRFLAPNYRVSELTGAVALAQLPKAERAVARRNKLGGLLTELLEDVKGILPAPVTRGGRHSYWAYPFMITGFSPRRFAEALGREGIPVSLGYTGKPIYLCSEALIGRKTFGKSGYPFTSPYCRKEIRYRGMCPVAERSLSRIGLLDFNENWKESDIRDVAEAFGKVAGKLSAP